MAIFDIAPGATIWMLVTFVCFVLIVTGVVFVVRRFVRLDRRVESLAQTVDQMAQKHRDEDLRE